MTATADGNCLFHSASIALLGNEDISRTLRLFAVLHAVLHFEHYMTKVNSLKLHFIFVHDPLKYQRFGLYQCGMQ